MAFCNDEGCRELCDEDFYVSFLCLASEKRGSGFWRTVD
jgi:hypothetical protein